MADVATHVRIFNADPTDDLVAKRTAVLTPLSSKLVKSKGIAALLGLANDVTEASASKGKLSEQIAIEVETAIKTASPAFVRAGNDLEVSVILLLSMLEYIRSAKPLARGKLSIADVLAAGLWSALTFHPKRQETKFEALREDIIHESLDRVRAVAEAGRKRVNVPDFGIVFKEIEADSLNKAAKVGTDVTVDALRSNASLDREELDILWWVFGDWSEILEHRISVLPAVVAAVTNGFEIARRLRKLPADAHKALALRNVPTDGETLDLSELLKAMGPSREKLAAALSNNDVLTACPIVFPLLSAIANNKATSSGSKEKRALRDWGARALLETAILHVMFDGSES